MTLFIRLIGRIGCLSLLGGAALAQADAPRQVDQTLAWQGQAINLHLNYPEHVRIEVGGSSELTLRAEVVLRNDEQDLSEDFRWQVQSSEGQIRIEADFGPRIGNTVIVRDGADVSGGIGEGASLTGTRMHIQVPRGAKLEVDSQSGELHLDHPGNTLLVENNGAVHLTLEQGIDFSYSSMLGHLQVAAGVPLQGPGMDSAPTGEYPRRGRLKVNGGGAETSVTTLVGDISLRWSAPAPVKPLSQQQLLEDFDQAIAFIDQFAPHRDLNARRLGIDYPREFQALRERIGPETGICQFRQLLTQALNLVQDLHANTMDYAYLSQFGRYQQTYNFPADADYRAIQALEQACPQPAPRLDLPLAFRDGRYWFYADVQVGGKRVERGSEVTSYNGQPIAEYIAANPTRVWPIQVDAAGQRYSTRFYRQGDKDFRLGLADGRQLAMRLSDELEWLTPQRHQIHYGSQSKPQVLYFDAEQILYIGLPAMDTDLLAELIQGIDAIAQAGRPIAKVVLDVRGNPGGNDATWHAVLTHLLHKRFELDFDMRFKDNAATRARYANAEAVTAQPEPLLDYTHYWRHPIERLSADPNPESIDFQGTIYLLVDPYIYSSAGNLANFALLEEQIVSVGASTDLVGGAQIEPLFFQLDHSELVFRLEPVLDFRQVKALADFDHNRVEVPIQLSIDDLYLRSTFEGEIYGQSFLRQHDPLFRYVVGL